MRSDNVYYYTKSMLPTEGRLIIKAKVSSRLGVSIEEGSSQALNMVSNRRFVLQKSITQCVFGHLKKKNFESYEYLSSNSGDKTFLESLDISINIISYTYAYPKFNDIYRYKTFNVKGKRYVQQFIKKDNRYVYYSRTRVSYDSNKKLNKTIKEYKMGEL